MSATVDEATQVTSIPPGKKAKYDFFKVIQGYLEDAAQIAEIPEYITTILSQPKNEIIVNFPVRMDSDKQTRAQAVTPLIEAGKIFLPESAPWVADFVEEMACFPNGVHDDVVDATTQALNYLRDALQPLVIQPIYSSLSEASEELDKEAIWDKALSGYPITQDEFERM